MIDPWSLILPGGRFTGKVSRSYGGV